MFRFIVLSLQKLSFSGCVKDMAFNFIMLTLSEGPESVFSAGLSCHKTIQDYVVFNFIKLKLNLQNYIGISHDRYQIAKNVPNAENENAL